MPPPSLLHLLFLVSTAAAAINPSLRHLCLSPLVDSPIEEDDTNARIKGDACEQRFPYPGDEEQHKTFCENTLPFDAEVVRRTNEDVTCRWTTASVCKKEYYQQIFDKCYHVGVCGNHDMKMAKASGEDEVRWISKLYGDQYQALHMERMDIYKLKEGFFEDGVMWPDKNGNGDASDVMVLTRMAAFGLYPGDFVQTNDPIINTLCSTRADAVGPVKNVVTEVVVATQTQLPSVSTVNSKMTTLGTGYLQTTVKIPPSGFAFPTRNRYRGRLNRKGEVDVEFFHGVCRNICQGCYAATYEAFEKHKTILPNGRYWVPAGRNTPSDKSFQSDSSCGSKVDQSKKKSFKVLINPNNPNKHIPDTKQWSDVPQWGCSDADRLGVQIVKDGNSLTYVDIPLFDYQPIMCISGAPVPVKMETGACYTNSEFKNGKCVCKPGFDDALGITELAPKLRPMGYNVEGTICVKKANCKEIPEEKIQHNAYILFLDGSCGVEENDFPYLKNFAKDVVKSLSTKKPIWIFLFAQSTTRKSDGRPARKIIPFPKNWDLNALNQAIDKLGYYDVGCDTHTFYNFDKMIDTTKHISGKKLVIWVSQRAQDTDEWHIQSRLRDNNYELFGVGVRSLGWDFDVLIKESDKKRLIAGYKDLPENAVTIVNKLVCDPYPADIVTQAIGQ